MNLHPNHHRLDWIPILTSKSICQIYLRLTWFTLCLDYMAFKVRIIHSIKCLTDYQSNSIYIFFFKVYNKANIKSPAKSTANSPEEMVHRHTNRNQLLHSSKVKQHALYLLALSNCSNVIFVLLTSSVLVCKAPPLHTLTWNGE